MERKPKNFGVGLIIGAALGAVATYFLSPKSGKENRDMILKRVDDMKKFINDQEIDTRAKEIYGTVTEETRKAYNTLRKETKTRMGELNDAIQEVDVDKYKKVANDVIETVRKEGSAAELIERGRKYLMTFINDLADNADDASKKVKKAVKEEVKEVKKAVKK